MKYIDINIVYRRMTQIISFEKVVCNKLDRKMCRCLYYLRLGHCKQPLLKE